MNLFYVTLTTEDCDESYFVEAETKDVIKDKLKSLGYAPNANVIGIVRVLTVDQLPKASARWTR
jgi:hypothetical protein